MIRGLKPYPKMKNSGVRWLGEVPANWEFAAVRRYSRVYAGATPSRAVPDYWNGGTIPWLASGDVNLRRITGARQFITEAGFAASSTKWIQPGSLVLALAGQGRTKGMVATVECRTTCNQSLAAIEPSPRISNYHFLAYYLESRYLDLRALVGDGLRDGLNLEHVRAIPTPLPPLPEQAAIVRFLDHADRQIRRYIRAKQKLIKLLEDHKQAIIHRAVTRGLEPNVRLKPSGVGWLGDVPEHWEVARAQTVCRLLSTKAHEQFVDPDGEHICVTARFVSTDGRSFRRCTQNLSPARRGDVLMVMSDLPRGRALARAYLVEDDLSYAVNQRVCILRPFRVHPGFLAYAANRHPELLAHDDGFNQTHLPNAAFKTMRLFLPPAEEQAAIGAFLIRETAAIEATMRRAESEIALLGEYRIRLIADIVTGKLDVREVAARLPREAEEPESLDEAEEESAADYLHAETEETEV